MSRMGRRSACWAMSRSEGISVFIGLLLLVAHGRRRELRDERVRVEALERERRDQVGCLAGGHELRERNANDGGGLEPIRPPPRRDVEVLELGARSEERRVGKEVRWR